MILKRRRKKTKKQIRVLPNLPYKFKGNIEAKIPFHSTMHVLPNWSCALTLKVSKNLCVILCVCGQASLPDNAFHSSGDFQIFQEMNKEEGEQLPRFGCNRPAQFTGKLRRERESERRLSLKCLHLEIVASW